MPYYIRQAGKHVSGPFDTVAVGEWLREGRVTAEMELSRDRRSWTPAHAEHRLERPQIRRRRRRRR